MPPPGGQETSGPLVDFCLLMYHVGAILHSKGSGPFFYLSKLEGGKEAALWNRIFVWTQDELGLPRGTIRACVLIENVFAAFEMEVRDIINVKTDLFATSGRSME